MNKSTRATFSIILLVISSAMILSLFGCFPTKSEEKEPLPLSYYKQCVVTLNFHGHFLETVHHNNSTKNVDWDEEWGGAYSIAKGSFNGNTFTGSWDDTDEDGERTWGSVTVILHENEGDNPDLIYDKVSSVEWIENFTYSQGSLIYSFKGFDIPIAINLDIDDEIVFNTFYEDVCDRISSVSYESTDENVDFSLQNPTCNNKSLLNIDFSGHY